MVPICQTVRSWFSSRGHEVHYSSRGSERDSEERSSKATYRHLHGFRSCSRSSHGHPDWDSMFLSQPPRLSATFKHESRSSSARVRSTMARATTIPPTHSAAVAWALARLDWSLPKPPRSSTFTIALNTISNARFALVVLRETSDGNAAIGQEFSLSSKCCRDRYARMTCGPTSADDRSTSMPFQRLFHSGSVKKQPNTSVYKSLLLLK